MVAGAGGPGTIDVSYYANGNLHTKSDVGTYAYSGINAGPHAVTGVSGGPLGTQTYAYDANGNMTSGGGRVITWTSFNQAKTIAGAGGHHSDFFFGAAHERVRQVSDTATTIYVGGIFEKVTDTGGGTEEKNYIMTPTGRVAVATFGTAVPVGGTVQYFHTDGLGSITAVTDETGAVVKRFAYDSWGKQIDPASGSAITSATNGHVTRGYTDHEMLADLGLIHCNGRVYDPVLGRFLSADPNVDGTYDSQGYNRYSYVGNNPMNRTDPSGYFSLKDIGIIVAVVVASIVTCGVALYAAGFTALSSVGFTSLGAAISAAATGSFASMGLSAAIIGGAGLGFGGAFTASLLNGGSIGDAFKAGVIGGVVGGISAGLLHGIGAQKMNWFRRGLAHGIVDGGASEATGGEFRHGFYAGFATGASENEIGDWAKGNNAKGITAAAIVGGTASSLGGGKFANGAVSGAFSYMFNYLSSQRNTSIKRFLSFGKEEGSTLVVMDSSELGEAGQPGGGPDIIEAAAKASNGNVVTVDLRGVAEDANFGEILQKQLKGRIFDNIALDAHVNEAGQYGSARMARLFDPSSTLMNALASRLNSGGQIWLVGCYGNYPTKYLDGVKAAFGGAAIYRAHGYNRPAYDGFWSQKIAGPGLLFEGKYVEWERY
jgi:RHS repeat-associated protein